MSNQSVTPYYTPSTKFNDNLDLGSSSPASILATIDILNQATRKLNDYFTIAFASVGIPGNLLSAIVFARLIAKKSNMGLLYSAQCLVDLTSVLIALFLTRGPFLLFSANFASQNDALCKLTMFMRRFPLHASSWMAVLTAFDRFTFVFYEQYFRFMKNKLILATIIIVILTLVTIINVPNLLYYWVPYLPGCTADFSVVISSDVISVMLRTYIPLAIMLVFNAIMIRKVSQKSLVKKGTTRRRGEHHFTMAVISFDVIFFLTHFPLSIFYILYDIKLYSNDFQTDAYSAAVYNLVFNVVINVSLLDQMFSFFTYFAFNKLFRNELKRLLATCLPFIKIANESLIDRTLSNVASKQ